MPEGIKRIEADGFWYQLVRSPRRRRTTAIKIAADRGVIVSAPGYMPEAAIKMWVNSKREWIKKQLVRLEKNRPEKKQFIDGEKHLYFGVEYPLWVLRNRRRKKGEVFFVGDAFEVEIPFGLSERRERYLVEDLMKGWYLKSGKAEIEEKAKYYAERLGVEFNRVTIKRVSSIWGSCSTNNNLNFNRKLIMAPHEVVDYVVIHEVCHLLERNHGPRFWALVGRLDGDYKKHRKWLKANHQLLTL